MNNLELTPADVAEAREAFVSWLKVREEKTNVRLTDDESEPTLSTIKFFWRTGFLAGLLAERKRVALKIEELGDLMATDCLADRIREGPRS